jgi:hypothetical protein
MTMLRLLKAAVLAIKVVEVRETPLLNRVIFVMAVAALLVPVLARVRLVTVTVELLGLFRTT